MIKSNYVLDQDLSTKCKRRLSDHQALERITASVHTIAMGHGTLSLHHRWKRVKQSHCDTKPCMACLSSRLDQMKPVFDEQATCVTYLPRYNQQKFMIKANWHITKNWLTGKVSSISHLAINCVLPIGSAVFEVVDNGQLRELQEMLQTGQASLRDHDEEGRSLLFVRSHIPPLQLLDISKLTKHILQYATREPAMCKFLIEKGLDVNHRVATGVDSNE
jgi:hypothetical protein